MNSPISILAIAAAVVFDGLQCDHNCVVSSREKGRFTGHIDVSLAGETIAIKWHAHSLEGGKFDVVIEHEDCSEGWHQSACAAAIEALFDHIAGESIVIQSIKS